jgi:PAS domain S-box-containing protein
MTAERQALSKIESLLNQYPKGLTTSAIARHLNGNRNSTAKYLEVLVSSGVAERKQVGASRVYTLAKRISLKSLMNHTSEYIIIIDSRLKIIDVNDSFLRFFDVRRESLEGKYLDEVPVGLLRSFHSRDILCNPAREVVTELDSVVGGETCYFRVKCLPTGFEDKETGYTILIHNISEQKIYEKQLIQSEAKYRAMIEAQTDLICRRKPDGTILFVNTAFLQFFKKKASEVEGSKFYPLDPQLGTKKEPAESDLNILPFHKDDYEQCVLLDNGDIRWLQWKNTLLTDPGGTITEIQSVGRDVTGQRKREREILLKRCSIESSENALVIFDAVGRIVYANRSFLTLFGCRNDAEVVGGALEKFIPQSGPANNINQSARILQQTGKVDAVCKGKKADNTEMDLEFHAILIKNNLHFPLEAIALLRERTGALTACSTPGSDEVKKQVPRLSGVLLLDPPGRIVSANHEFLTLSGYEDEAQVLGRPLIALLSTEPESPEALHNPAANPHNRKTGFVCGHILHRDGFCVPARISSRHIHDPGGIHLCSEVVTDVAGAMPPAAMNEMADIIPMPVFVVDLKRRVLWWNRAMESFTGVRKEDVIGTSRYRQAFYPYYGVEPLLIELVDQPFDKIHQIYPAVKKFGDTIILERYFPDSKTAEGRYLYEKASLLYDPLGNTVGYMGGVMDITDWKRSQEFMNRMKDEMEASLHPRILNLQEMIGKVIPPGVP